ncbi:linear amide C-N hydrolase, choloylglycine hydrolase family protein [Enterococcus faecalis 02-MB-P-10]|uniref:linear amide C-N hydrolase n=1 Tax=Enterococcus faecalis TaxID=1351 RepID=UPI0003542C08|nr:linear amide C-N hydrolase [Enterococcus faecalis]EPH69585.1 linear amide C-N hydrolase, choloylglycine hydrolase family protein [Enterococcus faecalis 02-MB-P-10]
MCTGVSIISNEGHIFYGRTMDLAAGMFGEDSEQQIPMGIIEFPVDYVITGQLEEWKVKYPTMGMGALDSIVLCDGINSEGLVGDIQVLMEDTRASQQELDKQGLEPVIAEEFLTYILTKFSSVKQLRDSYQSYGLIDIPLKYKGIDMQVPLHYTFVDSTGDGIVLEPTNEGALVLYDSIGVVTNSPKYDFHTTNIRNYIGLDNYDPTQPKIVKNNYTIQPIESGTGYGMFGLPGDYTSPSRFVRAFALANAIDDFSSENGINTLYSIFRSVIIPRGLEHASKALTLTDYTRYWSGYDLNERKMYVQTGNGLAFTSKKIDTELVSINYQKVATSNDVHVI